MPRPKLQSDEAVLDAARNVLLARGPAFTLADVARAVGLSRATLIQRFGDRTRLHHRIMERGTQEVRDYFAAAPAGQGVAPLWAMLRDLIGGLGAGEDFSGYLLLEWADVHDPVLNALSRERNALVRQGIAERLPAATADRTATASLVQAVIQGAAMQWVIEQDGRLDDHVLAQTAAILRQLFPGASLDPAGD